MDVQAQKVVVYVYELLGDEVKVKKIEHARQLLNRPESRRLVGIPSLVA